MQRNLSSLLKMAACLGLMTSLSALAADVSGTYSWTQAGRNGGPDRKTTLVLKADGEKLTGTITAPAGGRRGANADAAAPAPAAPRSMEIKDGKIKGDEISFNTVREGQNGSITTKYTGKVSGDSIKLKFDRPGRGGAEPTPVEVEAKKEAAK